LAVEALLLKNIGKSLLRCFSSIFSLRRLLLTLFLHLSRYLFLGKVLVVSSRCSLFSLLGVPVILRGRLLLRLHGTLLLLILVLGGCQMLSSPAAHVVLYRWQLVNAGSLRPEHLVLLLELLDLLLKLVNLNVLQLQLLLDVGRHLLLLAKLLLLLLRPLSGVPSWD
jgi:hypothetical protein